MNALIGIVLCFASIVTRLAYSERLLFFFLNLRDSGNLFESVEEYEYAVFFLVHAYSTLM